MAKSAWQQPGRFNNRQKTPRLEDLLPIQKLKSGVFYTLRFIGPPLTFAEHWIRIIGSKTGKEVPLRKLCLAYNDATGDFSGKCPYCDLLGDTPKVVTLQNAIDRKLQKAEPARLPKPLASENKLQPVSWNEEGEFYFKEKDSETWTPVVPLRLTTSPCQRIGDYTALNKKVDKRGEEVMYDPHDPDYGFDMKIKYDEHASAANAYFVNKEKNNALDDDEMDYHIYDLAVETPPKLAVAEKDAEDLLDKLAGDDKDGGRDDDRRGGGGGRGGSRRGAKDYLGDVDEDDADDRPGIDDEDDEPRGRGGGRRARDRDEDDEPPARGRGRSRDDDEEEPRGRSRGRSRDEDDEPPARSSRRSRDDDEDEAPRGRGRGRDHSASDDDEERFDNSRRSRRDRDDEDDEPRGRRNRDDDRDDEPRGRRSARDEYDDEPPARSSRRNRDEDDEAPRSRRRDEDDEPRGRGGRSRRNDGLDL